MKRFWWWLAVGLLAAAVVHFAYRAPYYSGDSGKVARGGLALRACLEGGQRPCPGVTHFPPAQLLLAAAGPSLGRTTEAPVYELLAELNLAAFAGVLWLVVAAFAGAQRQRAYLAVAVLVGSCLLNYAVTAFGEMLGVLLGVWLVLAAQKGRVVQAALAAALLGLTKDIAAPLAFALGVAALPTVDGETWRDWARRSWRGGLALAGGAALGFAATLAFNVLRYGTTTNTYLLDPALRVRGAGQWLLHFVALFGSPNGGYLMSMPLGVVVLLAVAFSARASWRTPAGLQRLGPLVFTVLFSVGIAGWFTPMGWWAWGARLSLPWLVPAVVLALRLAPKGALEGRVRWALYAVSPLALLHTAMLIAPERMFRYFESHTCPGALGSEANYACLNQQLFDVTGGLSATVLEGLTQPGAWGLAVLHGAVLLGSLSSPEERVGERRDQVV